MGRIVGLQNCAAQIPGIVAPILTGWLVQKTGNYEAPMALIAVFLAIGIVAYIFLVQARIRAASRLKPEKAMMTL